MKTSISAMEEGKVTLLLGDVEHKVDLDDVNADDIKALFGIDFKVKRLKEVETGGTILIKKKEKIKTGHTYLVIPPPPSPGPARRHGKKSGPRESYRCLREQTNTTAESFSKTYVCMNV